MANIKCARCREKEAAYGYMLCESCVHDDYAEVQEARAKQVAAQDECVKMIREWTDFMHRDEAARYKEIEATYKARVLGRGAEKGSS